MAYKQAGPFGRVQPNAPGISGARSEVVRFLEKVDIKPGMQACWLWKASVETSGYGYFRYSNGKYAHRAAYELLVGPIPEGMQIDHRCENKLCVKPDHLEAVQPEENLWRAAGRWSKCDELHPDTPTRLKARSTGRVYCAECGRIRERIRRVNALRDPGEPAGPRTRNSRRGGRTSSS